MAKNTQRHFAQAYLVNMADDFDEPAWDVIFYSSEAWARMMHPDSEVERASQYDHFAEQGYVPPLTLLEDGVLSAWPCDHCTVDVSVDTDGLQEHGRYLFCSAECLAKRQIVEQKLQAIKKRRLIIASQTRAWLHSRWPSAEIRYISITSKAVHARLRFNGAARMVDWSSARPDELL
jgi:hypothetical protein